jgi:hypothetical protein
VSSLGRQGGGERIQDVCGGRGTGTTGCRPRREALALALALGEAIRIDGDITINMTHLSFIDASSTRMILEAAASLGPSRTVVLRCRPAVEARFTQLGVDLLPHVSLVGVHD